MTNYRMTPLKHTEENRQRIIEKTRENMQKPPIKKPSKTWVPVAVATIALFMAVFLAVPYVQQAFFAEQNFTVEKVVIPDVPYGSLIASTYLDETNEFIYNTENGFYAFDVKKNEKTLLVDAPQVFRDYAVSKDWLVWAQLVNDENKIHILNRKTHKVNVVEADYFYGVHLQGDTFIYTGLQDKQPTYFKLNLKDGTTQILREIDRDGDGSQSRLVIEGNLVVFSEVFKIEDEKNTAVTVYDFETKQNLESYILPYEFAENILLKEDKIYSSLRNDNEPAVIGFIDRTTGDFNIIETSVGIHDYATDGEYFAIAVEKGESNTVQLFKLQEGELKLLSKLPSIRERLVLPRFTEQGTLVVNGEGKDKAMYLIRFNKEK